MGFSVKPVFPSSKVIHAPTETDTPKVPPPPTGPRSPCSERTAGGRRGLPGTVLRPQHALSNEFIHPAALRHGRAGQDREHTTCPPAPYIPAGRTDHNQKSQIHVVSNGNKCRWRQSPAHPTGGSLRLEVRPLRAAPRQRRCPGGDAKAATCPSLTSAFGIASWSPGGVGACRAHPSLSSGASARRHLRTPGHAGGMLLFPQMEGFRRMLFCVVGG